ncbi:hypothetical protein SAMN05444156_2174 [Verrucomicrobium sp. GAS474]|nr:hypothetical protein SAMN05444156_2174 [Verrucomicrobium sp. GAS474]
MSRNPELARRLGAVAPTPAPTAPASATPIQKVPRGGGGGAGTDRKMTKEERAYERILEARKNKGEILAYGFESTKLRLAYNTTYTPDFEVTMPDGRTEFHEVKGGYIYDGALDKFKMAAAQRPWNRFLLIQKGVIKYDFNDPTKTERNNP